MEDSCFTSETGVLIRRMLPDSLSCAFMRTDEGETLVYGDVDHCHHDCTASLTYFLPTNFYPLSSLIPHIWIFLSMCIYSHDLLLNLTPDMKKIPQPTHEDQFMNNFPQTQLTCVCHFALVQSGWERVTRFIHHNIF
jgi:hypothetical protein